MPASNFPDWQFCYFTNGGLFRVDSNDYLKKPIAKIGDFEFRKKGERNKIVKTVKSCNQLTWTQKT